MTHKDAAVEFLKLVASRKVREADGKHWVKPRLVAQVAFTEWTRQCRLRHPRFKGLRREKRPAEVARERVP